MNKIPLLFVVFLFGGTVACTTGRMTESMRDFNAKSEFARSEKGANRAVARVSGKKATPRALTAFMSRLQAEGRDTRRHGVYVESLETGEPLATFNEDVGYNPASVVKLATTLAALERLGPNQKFHTDFLTPGEIDRGTGTLSGDLILFSGRDPAFLASDAKRVGDSFKRLGVQRVDGALVVVGNFNCNFKSDNQESAEIFLKHCGLEFRDPLRLEPDGSPRGRLRVSVESDSLLHIVQYLNAHSVNSIADLLAAHVGGTEDVKRILVGKVGLQPDAVRISRGSGLEVNRMTPRDTVRVLRALFARLKQYNLDPQAVMAIAGVDSGTLARRFTEKEFAGSIIAKTGTLYTTDTGVAALAGVMHTKDRGDLLFAIYNGAEYRRIKHLRDGQDEFLKELMNEFGGPAPSREHSITHNFDRLTSRIVSAE
jgi:D-alanyl-D-alanine carboxypeptidase/D-alanyl-D-alanine-endopeptidase (penicillin-binding protein 4)